jgi:hypothetical protein
LDGAVKKRQRLFAGMSKKGGFGGGFW